MWDHVIINSTRNDKCIFERLLGHDEASFVILHCYKFSKVRVNTFIIWYWESMWNGVMVFPSDSIIYSDDNSDYFRLNAVIRRIRKRGVLCEYNSRYCGM